jgi:aspartate-semialdehyde dehydrogenase
VLRKKDKYIVAVFGAIGIIGKELLELLEERNFPVGELKALASDDSEGERLEFNGRSIVVRKPDDKSFVGADIAFFAADADGSRMFAPVAVGSGAVVIDNSSAFRMDSNVPLVVPEVNPQTLAAHGGIISCPNSSVSGMLAALKPIHDAAAIKRLVITGFLSASGLGRSAVEELAAQTAALLNFRDVETGVYPHQIAFNCLPHSGAFQENGYAMDEMEMMNETRKILGDGDMRVTATAVRVPVFRGYSAAINVETVKKTTANEIRANLAATQGIIVFDDPGRNIYPVPFDVAGKDEVFVGRIREDVSIPNGIELWIAYDNLRKGAALNSIQIAELLIRQA